MSRTRKGGPTRTSDSAPRPKTREPTIVSAVFHFIVGLSKQYDIPGRVEHSRFDERIDKWSPTKKIGKTFSGRGRAFGPAN
jgi:hypothetical protein